MTRTMRLVLISSVTMIGSFTIGAAGIAQAAPAPGAPDAVASTSTSYTVRAGDSLAGIAWQFGVRLSALVQANNIAVTSTIHPGDSLVIPAGGKPAASTPTPGSNTSAVAGVTASAPAAGSSTTYTVKTGDALASIASRNGVKLGALVKANNITVSSVIVPGQVLVVPPATMAIPAPRAVVTPPSSSQVVVPPAAAPTAAASAALTSTQVLVTFLRAQVGKPYKFFTAGPDTFDCSGLVVAGYKQVGLALPHQSRALAGVGSAVDWSTAPIAAGDLLFTSQSGDPAFISHVGIALDATTWIQAVGVGQTVRIAPIPRSDKIVAVRRIALP